MCTGFPSDSVVENPTAMKETWVPSLGRKDPLEKEMATHSSILALRIPWIEEPGGLQTMRSQRAGHDLKLNSNGTCIYIMDTHIPWFSWFPFLPLGWRSFDIFDSNMN